MRASARETSVLPSNELAAGSPTASSASFSVRNCVFFYWSFSFFFSPQALIEVMNWFFCPWFVYQRKVKGGLMDSFCGNSCCARLLKHLCENTAANYSRLRCSERLLVARETEYKCKKNNFFFFFFLLTAKINNITKFKWMSVVKRWPCSDMPGSRWHAEEHVGQSRLQPPRTSNLIGFWSGRYFFFTAIIYNIYN